MILHFFRGTHLIISSPLQGSIIKRGCVFNTQARLQSVDLLSLKEISSKSIRILVALQFLH